jgi:hypothetical protein
VVFNSKVSLSSNAWHSLVFTVQTGASGAATVALDGVAVPGLDRTTNYGTDPASQFVLGDLQLGRVYDIDVDDVLIDTPAGG